MPKKVNYFDFLGLKVGSIREVQSTVQLEPEEFNVEDGDVLDHLAARVFKLLRNCPVP